MKTYYAIKHKKYGLLGISVTPNGDDAEFCNSTSVEFTPDNEHPWLTQDLKVLKDIIENPVPWYNSGTDRPSYSYKINDVKIIEINIDIS